MKRVRELQAQGLDLGQAYGKAFLEQRIKDWPQSWGDDLHVLIYGDFEPPSEDISFPALGITINHEAKDKTKTVASSALCVLGASVKVDDKSIPGIIDVISRMNLFLGAWTLNELGNGACGWWSPITHETSGAVLIKLGDIDLNPTIYRILSLKDPLRQKVNAALYWVREPQNLLLSSHKTDRLRIYSAYWNAFECLVDAINMNSPRSSLSSSEKQNQIDKLLEARRGKLTSADIEKCYHEIVNPGFRAEATHALTVCFPNDAARYIYECFEISERHNRLYQIRNDIDHGNIDAENPEELLRVGARLRLLHEIVWGMFGQLIPECNWRPTLP